jgi:hypothetical protein
MHQLIIRIALRGTKACIEAPGLEPVNTEETVKRAFNLRDI